MVEPSLKCLWIKHLPPGLTDTEKRDLIGKYGAEDIRLMSDSGALRHSAFATFPTEKSARFALLSLHQMELDGRRLVVEYAKQLEADRHFTRTSMRPKKSSPDSIADKFEHFCRELMSMATFGSTLDCQTYSYPPPNPSIVGRISQALYDVPQFYIQVIHLMNKMSLPPPFGSTVVASSYQQLPTSSHQSESCSKTVDVGSVDENDSTSSDESELVSDEEPSPKEIPIVKPPVVRTKVSLARRIKMAKQLRKTRAAAKPTAHLSEVFQPTATPIGKKTMEIHLDATQLSQKRQAESDATVGTFGKVNPKRKRIELPQSTIRNDQSGSTTDVTLDTLRAGRLTQSEMVQNLLFQNYQPGDPSCRLYVKNIVKQATQEDLERIFRPFVDPADNLTFDVQLMTTGRMKGQAFVALRDIHTAEWARRETNGYQLHGKPIVVCFARSQQPKSS